MNRDKTLPEIDLARPQDLVSVDRPFAGLRLRCESVVVPASALDPDLHHDWSRGRSRLTIPALYVGARMNWFSRQTAAYLQRSPIPDFARSKDPYSYYLQLLISRPILHVSYTMYHRAHPRIPGLSRNGLDAGIDSLSGLRWTVYKQVMVQQEFYLFKYFI